MAVGFMAKVLAWHQVFVGAVMVCGINCMKEQQVSDKELFYTGKNGPLYV